MSVDKTRSHRASPDILCTLGPASLDRRTIQRLEQSGATLFRINLSHTKVADLARIVETIRGATQVPICLDSEGAQIRTGEFVDGSIHLRDSTVVRAHFRRVPGDDRNFNFYPIGIAELLTEGDFISIDFNSVLVQVIAKGPDSVKMRVLQGGLVGQNKAVTVERDIPMAPLTDKDRDALELGCKLGLTHFALSFAGRGEDVAEMRRLVGDDAFVISKIESLSGLENLEEIAAASDALLIDRGDLSRQVPIELLPQTQKSIIRRAKAAARRVYVATNLLESMVSIPTPTRAEVNDIYNTLADGADGLVLAAETAIGKYPIQCISMVNKLIHAFERGEPDGSQSSLDAVSLLVEPHGGRLIHREAGPGDLDALERLPRLAVAETELMDCEQFGYGTYSPLTGFMARETLESVLDTYRLPTGEVWTLPILLQAGWENIEGLAIGDRVALTDEQGTVYALLDVTDVYRYNLEDLAERMFGTTNRQHPGVARLVRQGDWFLGGDVTLVQPLPSPHRHYLLTPAQTRFLFTRLGWSQVVAFHSRNPPHRGHEAIQMQALEQTGADGIYINPVSGLKKPGDFLPEPILLSYQTLLEFGCLPKGKVVLGSFFTYSRYAGPREAVFTALCRKNMGCSHFIVGRDHAGFGHYYSRHANRELFESLGDLGVQPVFFETVGYNGETGKYEVDRGQSLKMISGSEVRDTLRADRHLPDWFMRDLVQEVLLAEMKSGKPVFYE
ncbi:MAG: sulfate adenylyltransferase [Rhodopirellula sp.]|nr:sulfate adenylyltransferase [Rhodopirellula sp.]